MTYKQPNAAGSYRTGRFFRPVRTAAAFLMINGGITIINHGIAIAQKEEDRKGDNVGPATININDINQAVKRLGQLVANPEQHLDEIKLIWKTWGARIDNVDDDNRAMFRFHISDIRMKLIEIDRQKGTKYFNEIFGMTQPTGGAAARERTGIGKATATPVRGLEEYITFPQSMNFERGWTSNPNIKLEMSPQFRNVMTPQLSDKIEPLFRAGLIAQTQDQSAGDSGQQIVEAIKNSKGYSLDRLAQGLGMSQKEATRWLELMEAGDFLGAVRLNPQSSFSREMIGSIREVVRGVSYNSVDMDFSLELRKKLHAKGSDYSAEITGKVQPLRVTRWVADIDEETLDLRFNKESDADIGLEATGKIVRQFGSKFPDLGLELTIQHVPSKVADVGAPLNLVGTGMLVAQDPSGKKLAFGPFSVYSGKIGIDTTGGISLKLDTGFRFPGPKPYYLALNVENWIRQSENIRHTPLKLRYGLKLETDSNGTPIHWMLYGLTGLQSGSLGGGDDRRAAISIGTEWGAGFAVRKKGPKRDIEAGIEGSTQEVEAAGETERFNRFSAFGRITF